MVPIIKYLGWRRISIFGIDYDLDRKQEVFGSLSYRSSDLSYLVKVMLRLVLLTRQKTNIVKQSFRTFEDLFY